MLFYQFVNAQNNFSKVDDWLTQNVDNLGGRAVMLIFKDGKIIYSNALNQLSRKQKFVGKTVAKRTGKDSDAMLADYTPTSKIPIASCSKWLSAALVMTFVDEGKLSLGDTVGKFLPILSVNGKGSISIEDCLTHATGINPGSQKESREMTINANNMDDAIAEIASLKIEAAPGTSFHYSSIGLQIAAAVIEKISGKDFETLFKERIATPCEMYQTDFGHKKVPLAAGGALSTATDYLHFLEMILNKGMYNGHLVLKKQSIDVMEENYTIGRKMIYSPAEAGNWGYGFGEWTFSNAEAGKQADAVTSPGLFGSFPWVDNKRNYAAVLLTFYLNNKGRNEKYTELKSLADDAITNN
jgi:CubicO group peptidase (beta-lactamase class C family)